MKKLIEALHVIQEDCKKHNDRCGNCPLFRENGCCCSVTNEKPYEWKINDEVYRALL